MRVETVQLDLPATAVAFGRRLRDAGLPVGPERGARFADALALAPPISRRRLYWTARAVFVSERTQIGAFDSVFGAVFGARSEADVWAPDDASSEPAPPDARAPQSDAPDQQERGPGALAATASPPADHTSDPRARELPVGLAASDDEVLRAKRFDALAPHELAQLHRLMSKLALATPLRRTRRSERRRHGSRIDMRRTLRGSLRTAGDPIRLARRERRVVRRRIVLLCDISGSMEPYARAYLQFLVCAAGAGPRAEAFVFATRLTRLTRALQSRNPDRAIARAAAAAPDWSSGTRIGDALKEFNDRHGRRGIARGAVVVILSDGWERGDPTLVGPRARTAGAARLPDRVGQPACRRRRLLAPRGRHGGRVAVLRRAGQRPHARGARAGGRGDRGTAGDRPVRAAACGRPRRDRRGDVGERDAGAGQLSRDAERLRAEPRTDDARLGARR